MKKIRFLFLLLAVSCIPALKAVSQVMEAGVNAGAAGYMGDLNPSSPFRFSGISAGAFVKANIDPYWALGLHYNFGKVRADDLKSSNTDFRNRALNFSSVLHELSLQGEFNFLDYFAGGGRKNFTPFIFTGIGGVIFNPMGHYQGVSVELRKHPAEGKSYHRYALSVPFGAGVKYRISEHLGLLTQIGYRTAFTDYLDDVSGAYPVKPVVVYVNGAADRPVNLSDPSGRTPYPAGRQRGDYQKRDSYMFVQAGISYTFLSAKCFAF